MDVGSAARLQTDFDPYVVLGIGRDASADQIRGAYRRAARASHPDLNPGDASAAERFKQVQVAYEALADPRRRAAYDAPRLRPSVASVARPSAASASRARSARAEDAPVSLARELGETVRAIRVMARRSGFQRRVSRLFHYLERL
jgi:DnaJ-class molecular chaperone